jgi:hypothetical protein
MHTLFVSFCNTSGIFCCIPAWKLIRYAYVFDGQYFCICWNELSLKIQDTDCGTKIYSTLCYLAWLYKLLRTIQWHSEVSKGIYTWQVCWVKSSVFGNIIRWLILLYKSLQRKLNSWEWFLPYLLLYSAFRKSLCTVQPNLRTVA